MSITDLFIGGIAGIISRTSTAPLELLKIQRQNNYIPHSTLKDVIKIEGLRHLWKGNAINCVRIFPQYAINFAVFEKAKKVLPIEHEKLKNFVSGGVGGAVAMSCIYPLETLRTRFSLQMNKSHYKTISDIRKVSFKELYGGLRMSIFGTGIYSACSFTSYYTFKNLLEEDTNINKLLSGGLAGVSTITISYPTDLIRRRLQLQGFDAAIPKYNGIVDCIQKIISTEGILGLYRGMGAAWIKSFPAVAIQFWALDKMREFKNKYIN